MKSTARKTFQKRLALRNSKGFTLVELLVVIGILGILAAALLAVIDPIEQLNKAQDQSKKNVAVEFVGAMQRYYATRLEYPMDTIPTCGTQFTYGSVETISGLGNCITELTTTGELKGTFGSSNLLSEVSAFKASGDPDDPVISCFAPVSKAYRNDPLTNYNDQGGTWTSGDKYWCAR